ncbi:MAG: tyrosine-type recombinase/integrase [bacterium]|nr:tyrosine-type recombinase/integrase [candidate division KSB1 bacterium]MDH7560452.1 tyrosine-type recombinase/integrase [bacterium]
MSVNQSSRKTVLVVARKAGLPKGATCHTFPDSFATHILNGSYDMGTLQELVGHNDVKTTAIWRHLVNRGGKGVKSPSDKL